MNFIFFTKTNWNEAPRIRHQLANLLAFAGNNIYFVQKPTFFIKRSNESTQQENRIKLLRITELLHHKLRVFKLLHYINSIIVARSINVLRNMNLIPGDAVIINFNYEYYFLRKIFPKNKIITIINDEFVSRALPGSRRTLAWAQKLTCRNSDKTLVVSMPLLQSLSSYCSPQLFLPWADIKYRKSELHKERNILLFWGYINKRLDFDLIIKWSKKLSENESNEQLWFVGPIASDVKHHLKELSSLSNVHIGPPSKLDALPLRNILAGIMPYKNGSPTITAATLPNKALQILARGIPLLITGMPNFIKRAFIFRYEQDICASVTQIKERFDHLQTKIEAFVEQNTGEQRIKQIMDLIDSCESPNLS